MLEHEPEGEVDALETAVLFDLREVVVVGGAQGDEVAETETATACDAHLETLVGTVAHIDLVEELEGGDVLLERVARLAPDVVAHIDTAIRLDAEVVGHVDAVECIEGDLHRDDVRLAVEILVVPIDKPLRLGVEIPLDKSAELYIERAALDGLGVGGAKGNGVELLCVLVGAVGETRGTVEEMEGGERLLGGGGQTDGGKYCHEDDSDTLHIDLVINFGAKVGKKIEKSHPRRKK